MGAVCAVCLRMQCANMQVVEVCTSRRGSLFSNRDQPLLTQSRMIIFGEARPEIRSVSDIRQAGYDRINHREATH